MSEILLWQGADSRPYLTRFFDRSELLSNKADIEDSTAGRVVQFYRELAEVENIKGVAFCQNQDGICLLFIVNDVMFGDVGKQNTFKTFCASSKALARSFGLERLHYSVIEMKGKPWHVIEAQLEGETRRRYGGSLFGLAKFID